MLLVGSSGLSSLPRDLTVCIPYGIKVAYPESGFTRLDIRVNPQKERLRVVAAIKFVYTLFPDFVSRSCMASVSNTPRVFLRSRHRATGHLLCHNRYAPLSSAVGHAATSQSSAG
jgi:hypothetical protein